MINKIKFIIVLVAAIGIGLSFGAQAIEMDHSSMQSGNEDMNIDRSDTQSGHQEMNMEIQETHGDHDRNTDDRTAMSNSASMGASPGDMSHRDHGSKKMQGTGKLSLLMHEPASGQAREAGFDNRYIMEATSVDDDIYSKCIKASRGLVMLDRDSRLKCGVANAEVSSSKESSIPSGHGEHMGH